MAVSNAVGEWLHEYPVTPARVLKALEKARAAQAVEGTTQASTVSGGAK
jgi:hypothetical protein